MTVRKSTGRCALRTNLVRVALLSWFCTELAMAASAEPLAESVAEALATAEGAWVETVLSEASELTSYDEQIFTEMSPILDSSQSVKLPEDQLLTD